MRWMTSTSPRKYKTRVARKAALSTVLHGSTDYVRNSNSDLLGRLGGGSVKYVALIALSFFAYASEPPGARPSGVAGHVPAQNQQAQQAPVDPSRNAPAVRWWAPNEGVPLPPYITYPNPYGQLGFLNTAGLTET